MVKKYSPSEKKIREIVREEISLYQPIYEVLDERDLSVSEKKKIEKAEKEYREGKTISFDEVLKKCMK